MSKINGNDFIKGSRYEIYIGLKDKDSYVEIITVGEFKQMLSEVCAENNIAFSLTTQMGGYTHNKGYTMETSLRIDLIGAREEAVFELGKRMKKLINTDTILVTRSEIEFMYI